MKSKQVLVLALAIAMIATVFSPAVSAAGEGKGIDLNASVKEPKPEIAISVDVDHISFGELLPGETSDSYPVSVTNIGLKALDVTTDVEDDGSEAIFAAGIIVNGAAWNNYSSQLVSDGSDSFDVALQIPGDVTTRGDISGSLTVWAEAIETPVAEFTADVTSGDVPLTVQFTDQSAGATSWYWDFGDEATSTEQNPQHTYSAAGTYDVSLTVTNFIGSDTETKTAYITANAVNLKIYSTGMANTNPGAPDPGIPGFVGPDGDGRAGGNNYVNPIFSAWATTVVDYSPSVQDIQVQWTDASKALGPVTNDNFHIVSLGDLDQTMIDAGYAPGSLTLGFNVVIINGDGPDFVAFENGFGSGGGIFAELGYVEVSTDGITFVRFPSVSLTPGLAGAYGTIDPTGVYNLVGKHVNAYGNSWGTPFDLSDLVDTPEVLNGSVDLNNINYVRIVDIPGSGDFLDSQGHPIYDAWVTWGSGGVDFEALGVINAGPKPLSAWFSADVTSGDIPLTVHFIDQSTDSPTSWAWDFNGDGVVDSYEQNPSYTYTKAGTYDVTLTVTNSAGSASKTVAGFITATGSLPFTYTDDGTSVTITGYTGPGGEVAIPGEIDGLPVIAIANNAFLNNVAVTSVALPDSITSIGSTAFNGCTALQTIDVDPANAVYSSVDGVLYDKPQTTLVLCPLAKAGAVTVPDSVTSIPNLAFSGRTGLTSVIIGSGVASIPANAFSASTALQTIDVDPANAVYSSVDGILYDKDVTMLIASPEGKTGQVVLPDSVTSLGPYGFYGCTKLTSITIGSGLTSIPTNAFFGCNALASVVIGRGVVTFNPQAFQGHTALMNISVDADNTVYSSIDGLVYNKAQTTLVVSPPGRTSVIVLDSVTTIGQSAFFNDNLLTSVVLGSRVAIIESNAFYGCTGLASIVLPDTVTTINTQAFQGCTALTTLAIPASVTSIGNWAFSGCTALTAFNVDADSNTYSSVDGILYNKEVTTLVLCPAGKTSATVPDSVKTIANVAFHGCAVLTDVTFGNGVTTIGSQAFYNCFALTSVVLPDSLTSLGDYAFFDCKALASVTIGSGISHISNYAFDGCSALTSVTIPDTVRTIGHHAFYYCIGLTSVEIGNNVTAIDYSAFLGCYALTSVTIPDSVTSIGYSAFYRCYALTSVTFGNGLTAISDNLFQQCTALTSVTIPDGVTSIGYAAFQGCTALTSVVMPSSLTNINGWAFQDCAALTTMVFNGNAPTVGSNWAIGCTDLVVYYNEGASGFATPTWQGVPAYPISAPVADFSADIVSGEAPLTVQFADQSVGATAWAWDFDNDGTVDSTAKNPSWTYNAAGTYAVSLTISNPLGSNTVVKTDYIVVTEAIVPTSWELFQGNQQLNGYYDGEAPDSNDLKWVSDAIDADPSSSVVIAEGKVFVYCYNTTTSTGYIAALHQSNGTVAWMKQMLTNPLWASWATPAYHDGLVFTAGDTARYASNGTIAWPDGRTVGTESTTNGGPMVAEGKVFCGDWDGGHYFAYDEKTGELLWTFTAGGYAQGTPSYHDGKIILTSWAYPGGNIYCVNAADGIEIWHATTALDTCGSPCIAGGYVYVTTYNFGGDGDIFCFYESNGTQVWTQKIQRTDSTPAVYDGKVYVTGGCEGVSPHQTYCFDAFDGTPIWATTEEQNIGGWTCSVVIADGKLFVGREASDVFGMYFSYMGLFALDLEDGSVLWETENGGATVAICDGVVFTAAMDGRIYAYGPAA